MREPNRLVIWYSCGAASAVAAKLALDQYRGSIETVVAYCDTGSEHPDNVRFMADCDCGRELCEVSKDCGFDWKAWDERRYS